LSKVDVDEIKFPKFKMPKINFKPKAYHIVIVLLCAVLPFSFYQVEPREEAVVLRFGKEYTKTGPGLHFKIPLIDNVYKVETGLQHKLEFGFLTDDQTNSKESSGYEDESWMLTADLKIAEVKWVVQYKIKDASAYLFNIRDVESTIRDVAEATMRILVGDRLFQDVLYEERVAIANKAEIIMQDILDGFDDGEKPAGIDIQLVQLQEVVPPSPVADSFNEVNRAIQEAETVENEAQKEYNKVIFKAEGEALQIVSEAEGYAFERINQAEGDAILFTSILEEYLANPQITKTRLYLETMEYVLDENNNIIVIDSDIENLVPFLDQNKIRVK